MRAEPELGQSEDPRELVRGDLEAVQATVGHLAELAGGFGATAGGLRAIDRGAWQGAAADAFRARFAEATAQWSRAAAAFGSAAQAWKRFGSSLAAAQHDAGTAVVRFRAGAAAADRSAAAYAADMQRYLTRVAAGQAGPQPVPDGSGAAAMQAARRMLADARAQRDTAAAATAREIVAAAALSPDPPTGWDRRLTEAADWLGANETELAHFAEGVGEGVESLVQLARTANPADPYNLNHPGRFVEDVSTALSGAADRIAHPLRLVTDVVGTEWGADPARAFGHLISAAAGGGARSVLGAAEARAGRSALGAAQDVARSTARQARRPPPSAPSPSSPSPPSPSAPSSLWADPRPTAAPFAPRPEPGPAPPRAPDAGSGGAGGLVEADDAAAERLDRLGRDLPSRLDRLAPADVAAHAPGVAPTPPKVPPPPRARGRRPAPHHDPERARQARLTRNDRDFSSPHNRRGTRKSHLDERGDLVPANPQGAASVVEHVVGRRSPVKGDSPYSSFTSPGAVAEVRFGAHTIEVDVVRLQADVDAGVVPGVAILAPHQVQAAIQAEADRIAGRPVDLYVRKGQVADAARSYGLGAKATAQLRQRMVDMANAQRHHEWMIRGVVPGRYVVGPHGVVGQRGEERHG
ncbi:MAG TPA: hypothetical protein VGE11_08155 [Pseudonocardia sp.]